jgi:UDP-glucuronate 4-epimerase
MSRSYTHLYGIPQTGLRFFTVYGPWGRPDMATFLFTKAILAGEPIKVFGEGKMARDFTFIDDIVDGVIGVLDHPASPGQSRIFNIGDNRPAPLMRLIELIEESLGQEAKKSFLPMQMGDVPATCADISKLSALCGYSPKVSLEAGVPRFVDWYKSYHQG